MHLLPFRHQTDVRHTHRHHPVLGETGRHRNTSTTGRRHPIRVFMQLRENGSKPCFNNNSILLARIRSPHKRRPLSGLNVHDLISYLIVPEKCSKLCDVCIGCCPVEAIHTRPDMLKAIRQDKCVKCNLCVVTCPPQYKAVIKVSPPIQEVEEKADGKESHNHN